MTRMQIRYLVVCTQPITSLVYPLLASPAFRSSKGLTCNSALTSRLSQHRYVSNQYFPQGRQLQVLEDKFRSVDKVPKEAQLIYFLPNDRALQWKYMGSVNLFICALFPCYLWAGAEDIDQFTQVAMITGPLLIALVLFTHFYIHRNIICIRIWQVNTPNSDQETMQQQSHQQPLNPDSSSSVSTFYNQNHSVELYQSSSPHSPTSPPSIPPTPTFYVVFPTILPLTTVETFRKSDVCLKKGVYHLQSRDSKKVRKFRCSAIFFKTKEHLLNLFPP